MASSSTAKQLIAAAIDAVLVIAAAAHESFAWEHWPVYAGALGAQLVLSTLCAFLRVRLQEGQRPPLRESVGLLTVVDIILTLPALSIAAAAGGAPIDAAVTWAALLAIGAAVMSERSGGPASAIAPESGCATPRSACSQRRVSRRTPGSSTLAPGSHSPSVGAAARSRRLTGSASPCYAGRSTPASAATPCAAAA